MTMTTKNNVNRTGIYVQESADVTTAGDGLGPRGHKSPVAQYYDNKLNRSNFDDTQNHEKNTSYSSNPLNNITSSIIRGGSEPDTADGIPDGNHRFRDEQFQQMKSEFLKIGFSSREIRTMQGALGVERRRRRRRQERETAEYRTAKVAGDNIKSIKASGNYFSRECNKPERIDQSEILKFENQRPLVKNLLFTSPAILAGAKEDDSPYSFNNRRKVIMRMKQMAFARVNKFEEARQRMGLRGRHIRSSDSKPKFQDSPYSPDKMKASTYENVLARQTLSDIKANYPIEVQILDKSHPFGEIRQENHFLLLDALETTIQDERVLGAHWINIGPGRYNNMCLHVYCQNSDTVKFLQRNVSLYNRLWRGADLFVTTEKVVYNRYKYRVHLEHYNLTSEEFFKIIKKQNGYHTEYWTLYHKIIDGKILKIYFNVDEESSRRLQESKGYVYFFFDRIKLYFKGLKNENSTDQIDPESL